MNKELVDLLQYTIDKVYGISITIAYHNNQILIQGEMNSMEELEIHLFLFGFLHGYQCRKGNMEPKLKIHKVD